MKNLYCEITDEKGTQVHKVANVVLCVKFFYKHKSKSMPLMTVMVRHNTPIPDIDIEKHISE